MYFVPSSPLLSRVSIWPPHHSSRAMSDGGPLSQSFQYVMTALFLLTPVSYSPTGTQSSVHFSDWKAPKISHE